MNPSAPHTPSPWVLAARAEKMNPSVLRELLKVTERPGIISFAGGLPSPKTFPVAEFAAACAKVLIDHGSRILVETPNFQNPTGRALSEARRAALSACAAELGLPLLEDNPYGELWFDAPPPAPLSARNPDGCLYLGSFSKVLAPKALYPKLLQAKQAADLLSPGFNQRGVAFVPGVAFYADHADARTLRLSFVTASADEIQP